MRKATMGGARYCGDIGYSRGYLGPDEVYIWDRYVPKGCRGFHHRSTQDFSGHMSVVVTESYRGKKSSRLRIMLCYKKSSRFLLNFAAYVGASPSLHHWEVSRLPSDVSLPAWSNKEFMSSCTPLLSPMSSSDVFRAPSPFGPHEEVQRLLSDIQGPDSSRTTCITRWVSHSLWPDITVETGWAVSSEMLSSRCHLESH
ncbi:hypothetical protein V6N11_022333 [Hibiscus sabdariffa]|uniref:Uncharacterized protein n=1 Tax=Hibiscus sabdariffa TaxID=183260 RepID=A0ABR2TIX2_9ROSI